jgi:hypothetical protein
MKVSILAAFALLLPTAAQAMTPSVAGVGAEGFSWLVGSWTCANSAGAAIGGPSTQTVIYVRNGSGGLTLHVNGGSFERSGYLAYVPSTRTWWQSVAYPNGSRYGESTKQTGTKTIWSGPYTDVTSGKTFTVRDTFTVVSPTQYEDVGQYQSGSAWKTGYHGVCKKNSA